MTSPTTMDLETLKAEVARVTRHQNAGRFAEAGSALDKLLVSFPDHPRLVHLKGINLVKTGDRDAGLALLERVAAHQPEDPAALVDLGTLLAQDGKLAEAQVHFRTAVEAAPNFALAHANLGAVLILEKDYAKAIDHLDRAASLDGNLMDVHLNLGQANLRAGRFQPAVNALFRALAIDPQSVAVHVNLAHALFRRERHETAEHHARRALELEPQAGEAWLYLGQILAASGRMEEAAEALLKSAALPGMGLNAFSRLAQLRRVKEDSPEWKGLTALAGRADALSTDARIQLEFALGKSCEDLGDPIAAFAHFSEGNRLTRSLHPYDAKAHVERAERLRSLVTPAFVSRHAKAGLSDIAPIFICGLPRSGTTLMELMLSRHPEIQAGGEMTAANRAFGSSEKLRAVLEARLPDDALTDDDFTRIGEAYQAVLHGEGLRGTFVTDKMPINQMYIGLLALALPRAKFLVMRRHPLDCLLSNYLQNFGQNQLVSTDLDDLAGSWHQFDLNAKHWGALLPDRLREVHYETLVANPEDTARDVLDLVGLEWTDAVLDHTASTRQVNTASVAQVRAPIYETSVARWRRFGAQLAPLAEALGPALTDEERAACGLPR